MPCGTWAMANLLTCYIAVQFEIATKCVQRSKASGFVRNKKQEKLVIQAVMAADSIPNEHVSLPAAPDQPALVTSQQDSSKRYKVSNDTAAPALWDRSAGFASMSLR